MSDIVEMLESLARREHDEMSVAQEAADEIKRLRVFEDRYVAWLEDQFESSGDDGAAYHEWQDALKERDEARATLSNAAGDK